MIAVSWSRFETFERCPKQFYYANVVPKTHPHRIPFVASAATDRGKRLHKSLEDAINSGSPLDAEINYMEPRIRKIRKVLIENNLPFQCEQDLAWDINWKPRGWFDKDVAMRMQFDFMFRNGDTVHITDWKSGKKKLPSDQLGLYALGASKRRWSDPPKRYSTRYVWLDHPGSSDTVVDYLPEHMPDMQKKFKDRSDMIQIANSTSEWPARQNFLCENYCHICPEACEVKRGLCDE